MERNQYRGEDNRYQGVLHKKSGRLGSWKKRYYHLENGVLSWFKNIPAPNTTSAKPSGSKPVRNCPCGPSKEKKSENVFHIITQSKTYILKAESTQEFQKWREVLKKNGALWMDDLWTNETQQSTSPNQTQQSQTQNPNRTNSPPPNSPNAQRRSLVSESSIYPVINHNNNQTRDYPIPERDIWPVIGWFGLLSRVEAERELSTAPDGSFLVRWSTNTNCYVVSYRKGFTINHISGIKPQANNQVSAEKDSGEIAYYPTLLAYIQALCEAGLILMPLVDRVNAPIYHNAADMQKEAQNHQ